jgi:hypothetical protein
VVWKGLFLNHELCSDTVLFTDSQEKEAVIAKLILVAIKATPRVLILNTVPPVPEAQKIPLTKNRFQFVNGFLSEDT